jgi:hypothetical protein
MLQALSDNNTDFLVVGVCSSETLSSAALVSALSGSKATESSTQQQLPGMQMHVSTQQLLVRATRGRSVQAAIAMNV